jgi:CheY-like chemotaxis protein
MAVTILLVEDEDSVASSLRSILQAAGYEVERAASLPEALVKLGGVQFDAALVHVRAPRPPPQTVTGRSRQSSAEEHPGPASDGSTARAIEVMGTDSDDFPLDPSISKN